MNRKKFMIGVFGVLFAIALISNAINSPAPPTAAQASAVNQAASPAAASTVSKADLARETQRILNETMPGGNWVEYDEENNTVRVFLYDDAFTVDALNAALMDSTYLQKWQSVTLKMAELEGELRTQYDKYDHEDLRTEINLVNPEDLTQIFATVAGGTLLYDLVDMTPPGEMIVSGSSNYTQTRSLPDIKEPAELQLPQEAEQDPEPTPDPTPLPGQTFVLNTNTHKYHDPHCSSVKDIKPSNYREYVGTREEVEAMGYVACKRCGG